VNGHIVHHARRCDPRHAWLPVLLPATARRVRVTDDALRTTFADAGAELVEEDADVEIAAPRQLRAGAPHALAPLGRAGEPTLETWPRAARGARRAGAFAGVWTGSAAAAWALRFRGYRSVRVFTWDVERPVGGGRFPLGAVVAADRDTRAVSLVEAVFTEVGARQLVAPPRISSWGLLCLGSESVLRMSVGPGRRLLDAQAHAFDVLHGAPVLPQVDDVVPTLIAHGRTGLAEWSLERRLPGSPAAGDLPAAALADCLELLADLHALDDRAGRGRLVDAAAVMGPLVGELEPGLRRLGDQLEAALAALPSTFAHGDLSPANLLIRDGRLSGVVDWNKAGGGRAPLHDMLNLRLALELERTGASFGAGFVDWLLPLMRGGGDMAIRSYCSRVGLDPSPWLLSALATAYWLDRVAGQITTYADRERRRGWLRENVVRPAAALLAR
jgi:Phosphotransferase enzyme family